MIDYKISVVMPSYLYEYDNSAKDRVRKFNRAINSFLSQTYKNKELIVVSDGCDLTAKEIIKFGNENIKFYHCNKKPLFSGDVRDIGCARANGDIICYLDTDDYFGVNHLSKISECFNYHKDADYIYFDDYVVYILNPMNNDIIAKSLRTAQLEKGMIGVSSIAHKNQKDINWLNCNGYGHDWTFVDKILSLNKKGYKISAGLEYYVCHIPNSVDN